MFHLCEKPEKDPFQLETSDLGGILEQNDASGILKHLTKIHHTQKVCPKGYESKPLMPKKRCNDKFNLRMNDKGEVEIHASMINKTFGPTDFCLIFEVNQMLSAEVCRKKVKRHKFRLDFYQLCIYIIIGSNKSNSYYGKAILRINICRIAILEWAIPE
jgi:hypothetical protein